MSRITTTFSSLQTRRKKALIPFFTAGYPDIDFTLELMHAAVSAGADLIELGVPFSDPMADGIVIQKASEVAIAQGVGLREVLALVKRFRANDTNTPLVLMGYANPIERYEQLNGLAAFAQDAAAYGVDGVLVVDYSPGNSADFNARMRGAGCDQIFMLAPTSSENRIEEIASTASGYVYCVSLKGVTGSNNLDPEEVERMTSRIRRQVKLPLVVGFGIRDADSAALLARSADGVVIGSKLIESIGGRPRKDTLIAAHDLLREIRLGLDRASARP